MINDFKGVLANFDFDGIWEDTLLADPEFPTVRNRGGWRAMEVATRAFHFINF